MLRTASTLTPIPTNPRGGGKRPSAGHREGTLEMTADPFIDGLTALTYRPPTKCAFGAWLDTLTPERQAAMLDVLAMSPKAVPATKIRGFASKHGYAAGVNPVQDHRANPQRCSCGR